MQMNEIETAVNEIATSSGTHVPLPPKVKKLPSKQVRVKKQDAHKKHLNQKTIENRLKPRLDAKRYFPEDDLAALLEECRRTVAQQPAKEIEVKVATDSMQQLCQETVEYLYNVGKIQPDAAGHAVDVINLVKVVEAVSITKIHAARRFNGRLVETSDVEYVNRVEKRFTVLPKVLNIFVEQLGYFTQDGQVFVPKKLPPLKMKNLAANCFATTMERNGPDGVRQIAIARLDIRHQPMYITNGVFTGDPFAMLTAGHGALDWVRADSLGNFAELCTWYERFISRCNRKAAGLLQNVVYGKGEGTPAQLVGSRDNPQTLQRDVWSCKVIDQNTLHIGGLFGFGLDSSDVFHNEDIAAITDRMDMDGLFQRIQRCQKL